MFIMANDEVMQVYILTQAARSQKFNTFELNFANHNDIRLMS